MSMDRAGVILCAAEEKHFISLMMWLQNHHNVSCVNMLSNWNVIDVLSSEADTSTTELLRDRLDDLIKHTGASLIAVVDYRSGMKDQGGPMSNRERLNAALQRAQSWFPDLTVIGLSVDDRFRVLSEVPYDRRLSG